MTFLSWLCTKGITTYKNYCNCGGYAASMTGRDERYPHMRWCDQYKEYNDLYSSYEKDKNKACIEDER